MIKCPKKPQEKCDYAKTVIYKIECKDPNITKTYGGHSTNLIKRRARHKSDCNNPNAKAYKYYVYQFIRENGGWENWRIVWQYDYPCASKKEATLEESKYVKQEKCELNSVIPYISEEEKKEKNKEYQKIKRENETPEEKAKRLKEKNEVQKTKRDNETAEEKAKRLKEDNDRGKNKRKNETPEEKAKRLKEKKDKNNEKLRNETPDEKAKRLKKNRENRKKRTANETSEQKEIRLQKEKVTKTRYREKKKAEKEAQKNLMTNSELKII